MRNPGLAMLLPGWMAVALQAFACGSPSAGASSPGAAAAPPAARPEPPVVVEAHGYAAFGSWSEAGRLLREAERDPGTSAEDRAAVRVFLVELWLDHVEVYFEPACVMPADEGREDALPVPQAVAAEWEAARLLERAEACGGDPAGIAGLRERLGRLEQRHRETCDARGVGAWGDRDGVALIAALGRPGDDDPCLASSPGTIGFPGASAIDEVLGVPPAPRQPSGPDLSGVDSIVAPP